jgi:phosphopantothenoylcysteine decarboxylase/phosphopantothenate--cysteine ligase
MEGQKVLIVTGATREPIDDMRVLTNRATGRTGIALAVEAYRDGADVLLLAGQNVQGIPDHIPFRRFTSTEDLLGQIEILSNEWNVPTMAYFAAGISDYSPMKEEGKIPSNKKSLSIKFEPTPKVIERFRRLFPETFLVGYKAESLKDRVKMLEKAFDRLQKVKMQAIVANDLSDVSEDSNTILMLTPDKEAFRVSGNKSVIATFILEKSMDLME